MFKKLLIFAGFLAILGACTTQEQELIKEPISLKEVLEVLTEEGYNLDEKENIATESVFAQELNAVTPEVYSIEENMLSIYIFASPTERAKGIVDFEEKTATMEVIEHHSYGINNILVFYVSEDEKLQKDLFDALILLDTPK
ncbi:hypothetical protein FZC76_14435 [Sutcliffiella horikoshii]|uniref:Lipoprotein n=1 Tax=Sutcliffiella horikoshii TaxID=79883 RepID=A0A5D4T0X9_9BACI|nr:hypothetical protein [Sutcliffiella horikoshii]TYS67756.1 hypothetical protein FZC76_14435 [Sutcliffiella horikoshii]